MFSQQQIEEFFSATDVVIAGNALLRTPQIQGHQAAVEFFEGGGQRAIEQIPVGCGKTGLISILPFRIARGRVLVIAPNLTIKTQIADAIDISRPESFYRRTGVLRSFDDGPYRALLDRDANLSDCDDAHIVVTNIHQLAESAPRWLPHFAADFFDLIIVDEGHHNAAPSWRNVFDRFPDARVVSLTATPFRADEQPIEGEVIYRYPFREAMRRGYIKRITATNVAPSEIYFTWRGDDYHHTLAELMELREQDWVSRGVALSPESNISIVDASIQWLHELRVGGLNHQLIAVACSLDHARQVRGLYEERGLHAREIHSNLSADEQQDILRDLRSGQLDAIVQVQMLGEGFDHPPLSVAAIFRPFRSLSPYIQFVGRVMRVNVESSPDHPDNEGVVVSHVGLNIDRHWDDFKEIDRGDQEMIEGWLDAGEVEPEEGGAGERRRLAPDLQVTREVIDRFLSDSFLDPSDDAFIEHAITTLRDQGVDLEQLGLTREELQRRLLQTRAARGLPEPERLPVQPQAHRQMLRSRLNEQIKSAASRICEALDERVAGRRIATLGGTGASNNLGAVIILMNRGVNQHLGIENNERRDQDTEALERAIASLDEVADSVQADLAERLG
jgi:superfamily II DNA or RNA helicase